MWRIIVGVVLIVNIPISHTVPIRAEVARKDSHPYSVIINPKDEARDIFSGALITRQYVLTAASPFVNIQGNVIVSLGVHNRNKGFNKGRVDQEVNVTENVIIHDEYDDNHPLYDNIALLKLNTQVDFSDSIKAIRLPKGEEQYREFSGTKVSVIGWGMRYRGHSKTTNSMNYYNTTVFPQDLCSRYYPVWERNLCTDATQTGHYCVAQYGSPIVTIENPLLIAIGLDPVGCSGGLAIVNTRISPYLYWIDMNSNYDAHNDSDEDKSGDDDEEESASEEESRQPKEPENKESESKPSADAPNNSGQQENTEKKQESSEAPKNEADTLGEPESVEPPQQIEENPPVKEESPATQENPVES